MADCASQTSVSTGNAGKTLDQEIADLENYLSRVSGLHDSAEETLAAVARKLDTAVAEHVSSTLPALCDLIAVARYFWAGMIDDDDDLSRGEEGGEEDFDENDVDRVLRGLKASLASLVSTSKDCHVQVSEPQEAVAGENPPSSIEELRAEAATGTAYNLARDLWLEVDQERLPEARALLKANMEAIGRREKALADVAKSAEPLLADEDLGSQTQAPKGLDFDSEKDNSNLGIPLEYVQLDKSVGGIGQASQELAQTIRDGRGQLCASFSTHQVQAGQVTRLVCQATTLKLIRDELYVRTLIAKSLGRRRDRVRDASEEIGAVTESLLEAVDDLLNKLEWTDVRNDGTFPAEELLKLSARLLVDVVDYCDESKRKHVAAILRFFKKEMRTPLPQSVTDILQAIEPKRQPPVHKGSSSNSNLQARVEHEQQSASPSPIPDPDVSVPDTPSQQPPSLPSRPAAGQDDAGSTGTSSISLVDRDQQQKPLRADGLSSVDPMPFVEESLPPPPPQLQILGASWGGKDVTPLLQIRVKDNQLVVDMSNLHTVLGDPMPYKYKHLTALYRYGNSGTPRLFILSEQRPIFSSSVYVIRPEPSDQRSSSSSSSSSSHNLSGRLSIPIDEGWKSADGKVEILAVTYGPKNVSHQAVFASLGSYFAGEINSLQPGNDFFRGDPWPGETKTWTVFVRFAGDGDGAVRCVTGVENQGLNSSWAS